MADSSKTGKTVMADALDHARVVAESVNALAKEIARQTKVREEQQSLLLASHGDALGKIQVTLARIDERTANFAANLTRLEKTDTDQQTEIDGHGRDLSRTMGVGVGMAFLLGAWQAMQSWIRK
jgi:hypothetical protein